MNPATSLFPFSFVGRCLARDEGSMTMMPTYVGTGDDVARDAGSLTMMPTYVDTGDDVDTLDGGTYRLIRTGTLMLLVLMASALIDASFFHVVVAFGSDNANAPPTSSAPPVVGTRRASSASLVAGAPIHVSEPESEPDVETLDGGTHRLCRTGAVKWL